MKDILLDEVFIYLLERTQRQTKRYANQALRLEGIEISSEQWVILKRISEQDSLNQKTLADLTYKDPASVTRTLDLLEKEALIRREAVDNDRRAYHLQLTNTGKALVERILPIAQAVRTQGLKDISDEELTQFKITLNKIYQNYSLETV